MGVGSFENMGGTVINRYANTKAAVSQYGDKSKNNKAISKRQMKYKHLVQYMGRCIRF